MEGIGNPGTCHSLVKVELYGGVEGVLGHVQDEQHGAVLHQRAEEKRFSQNLNAV